MKSQGKAIRQSVSLPAKTAAQVRSLARTRKVSASRMLVELIGHGIETEKRKQQEFFALAEQFRSAADPEEAKRLGDALGRMVFGDRQRRVQQRLQSLFGTIEYRAGFNYKGERSPKHRDP